MMLVLTNAHWKHACQYSIANRSHLELPPLLLPRGNLHCTCQKYELGKLPKRLSKASATGARRHFRQGSDKGDQKAPWKS